MSHKVFVYGTLKRNHHANRLMGTKFLGEAWALGKKMYDLGGFPCCVSVTDKNCSVKGEVFEVEEHQFKALDAYEGVDGGLFKRSVEQVILNGECLDVMMYLWGDDNKLPTYGVQCLPSNNAEWRPSAKT